MSERSPRRRKADPYLQLTEEDLMGMSPDEAEYWLELQNYARGAGRIGHVKGTFRPEHIDYYSSGRGEGGRMPPRRVTTGGRNPREK